MFPWAEGALLDPRLHDANTPEFPNLYRAGGPDRCVLAEDTKALRSFQIYGVPKLPRAAVLDESAHRLSSGFIFPLEEQLPWQLSYCVRFWLLATNAVAKHVVGNTQCISLDGAPMMVPAVMPCAMGWDEFML